MNFDDTNLNESETDDQFKKRSQWSDVWVRMRRNKLAMIGMCIVVILVLLSIFANIISPYDYTEQDMDRKLQFPSREHLLGTDNYGRDIFSRILHGGRTSLLVSLMSCSISLGLSIIIGSCAGFFGRKVDMVIMRVVDILQAMPAILMAVCVSAILGTGTWQTAVAVSAAGIAPGSRMIRATILTIREREFVEAARAGGAGSFRIVFTHVLPNCLAPIIVDTTLRIGANILSISGLSFIGLGVQPPIAEWGSMLNIGRRYIRSFWPMVTFPGVAIFLTMFGFNVFGDGLRDALDPKLKR